MFQPAKTIFVGKIKKYMFNNKKSLACIVLILVNSICEYYYSVFHFLENKKYTHISFISLPNQGVL